MYICGDYMTDDDEYTAAVSVIDHSGEVHWYMEISGSNPAY